MPAFRFPKRPVLAAILWLVVGVNGLLLAVQLALVVFAKGEWQWPDYYDVEVVEVSRDASNPFTRDVDVLIDGQADTITLPASEAAQLKPHQVVWVLDNYYATSLRPAEFLLTPGRVLAEFPEVLLLLAILGLVVLRRSRWGLPPAPAPVPEAERKVYRDTFHARADRHAAPKA